ncbi:MAG TPA: hypothetical protein VGK04_05305 [Thermoanaerobaculia bacterium]
MDIVAVPTKVVQEQQKTIDQLSQRIEQLENSTGKHPKMAVSLCESFR